MGTKRPTHQRRGVLLLIILALLAMFGVVAIAFVVMTGQHKSSSLAAARIGTHADPPEQLLNEAAFQVLRGSKRRTSVLRTHSLLEDMYGTVTPGELSANASDTGGGVVEIPMPQAHLRLGRWLTMLTGPAAYQSRQIAGYRVSGSGINYTTWAQMPSFRDSGGNVLVPVAGDRYILYDAPWFGTMRQDTAATPAFYTRAVVDPSASGQGQLIEFTALSPPPATSYGPAAMPLGDLHRFVGCVLTMLTGPAAGQSTRIVGFVPGTNALRIAAFERTATNVVVGYVAAGNSCEYIINGTPFSGAGFGLNPNPAAAGAQGERLTAPYLNEDANGNGTLDSGEDLNGNGRLDIGPAVEYALAPNPTQFVPNPLANYVDPAGPGGANEDYDAVDYQNMLLSTGQMISTSLGPSFLPSLHRPELVNYWYELLFANPSQFGFNWPNGWSDDQKWKAILQPSRYVSDQALRQRILALKRKVLLRPLTDDHPDFNGSNPDSWPTIPPGLTDVAQLKANYWWERNGPWDVDNDGDGVRESLWVDLGAPVRATADGRLCKPLFAIHCVDLDGRLNLNAHGSTVQLAANYGQPVTGPYAGGTNSLPLPRGEGYGPADVRLAAVINQGNEAAQLMRGLAGTRIEGRYGESTDGTAEAGLTGQFSRLSQIKHFQFPLDYTQFPTEGLSGFGSPPDLWGRGTIALDYRGQPYFSWLATANESRNHPYELDLSRRQSFQALPNGARIDNPFTVGELEPLLRMYDLDASVLPSRLRALAPQSLTQHRHEVTTDSWDVPSPSNTLVPGDATSGAPWLPDGHQRILADLILARMMLARKGNANAVLTPAERQQYLAEVAQMVSWDLLANLRMDVNRPFGNGRDNQVKNASGGVIWDFNNVVDEPQEALGEAGWAGAYGGSPVPFDVGNGAVYFKLGCELDVNGDGTTDAQDDQMASRLLCRQLYARHLFVLAMLLTDPNYVQPATDTTPDNADEAGTSRLTRDQLRELTVRRIAQWAVNVVDFRDPDAIMTPFEYVLDPFDGRGWNVDGDVTTDETQLPSGNPRYNPNRRVVWGCEAPELVLTETAAFHDRRVADTAFDTGKAKRFKKNGANWEEDDLDLDQTRIPQGSAFFELYCARNGNNPTAPPELYTYNSATRRWYLDLGRLAPAGANGLQYPVWRLVISTSCLENRNNDLWSRTGLRPGSLDQARPDSTSTESEQVSGTPVGQLAQGDFNLLGSPPAPPDTNKPSKIAIDRIVWFTEQAPVHNPSNPSQSHLDWDRIYYNRQYDKSNRPALARYLLPGRYLVVGPSRAATDEGSLKGLATHLGSTDTLGKPSKRRLVFLFNPSGAGDPITGNRMGLSVADKNNNSHYPLYDPAAADPEIQMPEWMIVGANQPDSWSNDSPAAPAGIGISISEPLVSNYYPEPTETNPETGLVDAYGDLRESDNTKPFRDKPEDSRSGRPLREEGPGGNPMLATGTYQGFKIVLLQRLANPLLPFDPVANPYRTVDWSPIDLTVFNGEARPPSDYTGVPPGLMSRWDPEDPGDRSTKEVQLGARQRGGNAIKNLWTQGWENLRAASKAYDPDSGTEIFKPELDDATHEAHTLGFLNRPYGDPMRKSAVPNAAYADEYYGSPQEPFPWLTWNNRPYVNPMELLLVPTSHPGRLFLEVTVGNTSVTPYDADNADAAKRARGFGLPFGHLANFFHGSSTPADPSGTPPGATNLYRILEYLRVPSQFVGTESMLNPSSTYFGNTGTTDTALLRPPFSMLSKYREPGRVNLNTLFSETVWQAVRNGHPGPNLAGPGGVAISREGFASSSVNYPTLFANPFRTPGSAGFVPPLRFTSTPPTPAPTLAKRGISVSLLRARGANPDRIDPSQSSGDVPLFFQGSTLPYNGTNRNAYFAYQGLQRIGNLVTTRSNVYAVWITMGYFEVRPVPTPNPDVYPDGYMLGQELGSDSGEVKRHRAFYIIDRSIPVGFRRGEDLNVGNCVLLKRFIE